MTAHKDPNNILIHGTDESLNEIPIKVTDDGTGKGLINSINIASLIKVEFDEFDVTWVAGTVSGYNATKLEFKKSSSIVATINITYDANDNPINVAVS